MYLLGAGGHAKVILDILKNNDLKVKGFFDDNLSLKTFNGLGSLGSIQEAEKVNSRFIIAIGSNLVRQKISKSLHLEYISAIHPRSIVDHTVKIGEGTVVMAGAVINADSVIGQHVIINTGVIVDHDCEVGNYVHLSPNSTLSGGIKVEEGAHIGSGAIVIPGVTIGAWATVGAGTVVIKDVPPGAVVVGNPARIIRV